MDYLNTNNAAAELKVHRNTLLTWLKRGQCPIKPVKMNHRLRWPAAAVKRLAQEGFQ
jgi:hypothetical protein